MCQRCPGLANRGMSIPAAAFVEALLTPGGRLACDGEDLTLPDIRMIYWAGGNPFHHHQDLHRLERGWSRAETVVVHEPWWTATAQRADIVLPATTTAERNDIGGTSRDPHVVFMSALVPPQGQARNDRDILGALAERLGCRAAFDGGLSETEALRQMWAASQARGAREGLAVPTFEQLRAMEIWRVPAPEQPEVLMQGFRADPEGQPLGTPSGRIELTSARVAGFGYDEVPGHAVFLEPCEWLGVAAPGQFHLLTSQPETQLHGQLWQTSAGMQGAPAPVRINPSDAAGYSAGQVVALVNDRGACRARLHFDPGLRRGVLVMPTGAWFDPDPDSATEKNGNPNVLTADRRTSRLGQGSAAQSVLVRLAPDPITT